MRFNITIKDTDIECKDFKEILSTGLILKVCNKKTKRVKPFGFGKKT